MSPLPSSLRRVSRREEPRPSIRARPKARNGARQAAQILRAFDDALAAAQLAVEPRHGLGQRRIVVVEPGAHGVGEDQHRALKLQRAERALRGDAGGGEHEALGVERRPG